MLLGKVHLNQQIISPKEALNKVTQGIKPLKLMEEKLPSLNDQQIINPKEALNRVTQGIKPLKLIG